MNLKNLKRKVRTMILPTIAVGGEVPSKEKQEEIKKDTEEKIEKFKSENPSKPVDDTPPINAPVEIKIDPFSADNAYLELAMKYLGMNMERNPSLVEMAKSVITKIDELNRIIYELKKPRNDGFGATLYSSDSGGSWN